MLFKGTRYYTRSPERNLFKIKNELPKYDGKDHKGAVVWVNKMDAIISVNRPLGSQRKVITTSNYLEGEAYYWFLWWSSKCSGLSFNWENFKNALLKRFHDEEEDDVYERFVHLKQKGPVSEYSHEWEVLAVRKIGFSHEDLLKMYRCGFKYYIKEELKLCKPQTIEDATHATLIIERKHKLRTTSFKEYRDQQIISRRKETKKFRYCGIDWTTGHKCLNKKLYNYEVERELNFSSNEPEKKIKK